MPNVRMNIEYSDPAIVGTGPGNVKVMGMKDLHIYDYLM